MDTSSSEVEAKSVSQVTSDSVREKVFAIFEELAGERFRAASQGMPLMHAIQSAIASDFDETTSHDIGFHLADWIEDAEFLVALKMFPERFTKEEVAQGVLDFVIHAPNHCAAAAALHGHPVSDIFEVLDRAGG
jgi:hypothetical protein